MRRTSYLQAVLLLLLLLNPLSLRADTLYLTAVYWPPYAGPNLTEQGAVVYVVKKALANMGHELKVDFYGASRAQKLAAKPGGKYLGMLPVYEYQTDELVFSRPVATSPIGLVEMKLHPLSWLELEDLQAYTLGVGEQVLAMPELAPWFTNKRQPVREASSDQQNLRMVATARVDAAVMDMNSVKYLLQTNSVPGIEDKLQPGRRLLAQPHLFVALQRSDEGRRWLEILNTGLSGMDTAVTLAEYWQQLRAK
ncbi:substrate-binding periplasmic protein [Shewanella sp. GXUN23E]|uniref:substrate-binding periplasmic protein n=1 Tax=Shewanella sp. GXUN23E TaxID=3422498 RepID=UPI003D7C60D8